MAARDAALLAAVIALMLALPIVAPRELIIEPTLDLLWSIGRALRGSLLLVALLLIVVGAIWLGDSFFRARSDDRRGERGVGALIVVIAIALLAAPAARMVFGETEADDVPIRPVPVRPRVPRSTAWYEGMGIINLIALAVVIGLLVYVSADVCERSARHRSLCSGRHDGASPRSGQARAASIRIRRRRDPARTNAHRGRFKVVAGRQFATGQARRPRLGPFLPRRLAESKRLDDEGLRIDAPRSRRLVRPRSLQAAVSSAAYARRTYVHGDPASLTLLQATRVRRHSVVCARRIL